MKPIVELISAWDDFAAKKQHSATVEEFCKYYLNKQKPEDPTIKSPGLDHDLAKVIGRLGSIHKTYSKISFKQLPGAELEWYYLLNLVTKSREIKKTDVASINLLLEPTTCIDIINRMIKAGLLNEKPDPNDKRARLLTTTKNGDLLLKKMQELIDQTNESLYGPLDKKTKEYLLMVLSGIETNHTAFLLDKKSKRNDITR